MWRHLAGFVFTVALSATSIGLGAAGCGDEGDAVVVGVPNNQRIGGRQLADTSDRNAALNQNEPVNAAQHPYSGQRPPPPPQRFVAGRGPNCLGVYCICPEETTFCDSACVDTQTDSAHCGECGVICDLDEVCDEGSCD